MKMRIGTKSFFSIILSYLLFIGFLLIVTLDEKKAFTIVLLLSLTLIVISFFLFKVFIIKEDKMVIRHIFNPFKADLVLFYNEIKNIIVIRNTMQGSSTVLKIFMKYNSKPIMISSIILLKKEHNLLLTLLREKNINIDKIEV